MNFPARVTVGTPIHRPSKVVVAPEKGSVSKRMSTPPNVFRWVGMPSQPSRNSTRSCVTPRPSKVLFRNAAAA